MDQNKLNLILYMTIIKTEYQAPKEDHHGNYIG